MTEKPPHKLRFPSTGPDVSRYLLFNAEGALVIETEDYGRPYDESLDWISPEDTCCFLRAIGEAGRQPAFVDGEPTPQTKAMLRRIMTQFTGVDDLYRCWNRLGIVHETFRWRDRD